MDIFDSDSDHEGSENQGLDLIITEAQAKKNYEEAGMLVKEDSDKILIENHKDLIDDSVSAIINEVVMDKELPYVLSDFQLLSLNTLLQKKNLILCSPTGSGKV